MKKHLKRLAIPKAWKIPRKIVKFAPKPRGPHPSDRSIPLLIIIRDILKITRNSDETKKILKRGEVLVDFKIRKDPKFGVGLFDILSIPKLALNYRVILNRKGRISLIKIDASENTKICKIIGKRTIPKNKIQLNLHDGRSILTNDNKYKVGDSLLISLPNQEIKQHLKFVEGSKVFVASGRHIGTIAVIEKIIPPKDTVPARVILRSDAGKIFETSKEYVYVIGTDKPMINLVGEYIE
ncbi:MAG: 30S ribosomal protein S4e [Candidatus Parvarchaeota archaeon]|nr:30S ribosomal protein S4e [Candidatus Jingweiarchaeum tengchongense]MCW1297792.1 30S ribosomal protein S4e [Candidatus Jingweiarchaeum tengchongense]MCW1299802.1 30S ribosomal protein S4e [Candidatus Jingweiarchaeum tengchongense]MCW1304227.1 30S ribosomal protein S4e [Candidatus Jingweiarchaeum tengchongense]MCW1305255.1 30S ribosomal protein S4e [Candidatus Jingweiarchaeum tengchongense]